MYDWKCPDARATVSESNVLVAHSDDDRFEMSIRFWMFLLWRRRWGIRKKLQNKKSHIEESVVVVRRRRCWAR